MIRSLDIWLGALALGIAIGLLTGNPWAGALVAFATCQLVDPGRPQP